jgi:hypothetical protein
MKEHSVRVGCGGAERDRWPSEELRGPLLHEVYFVLRTLPMHTFARTRT